MSETVRAAAKAHPLHALTGIRFFAALGVYVSHTAHIYYPEAPKFYGHMYNGVSLFFVLSGFVLFYNHPALETAAERKVFWIRRAARIWPAHLLASAFYVVVTWKHFLGYWKELSNLINPWFVSLCNLLLLQSWIPLQPFIFSLNGPSWSVSCELFFYLLFPFLLCQTRLQWTVKTLVIGMIPIVALVVCTVGRLPSFHGVFNFDVTANTILQFSPVVRIWEFFLGMLMAMLFARYGSRFQNKWIATALQAFALACMVAFLWVGPDFRKALTDHFGEPSAIYALVAGDAPLHALMVFSLAFNAGWLARFLSFPVFLILGEISYGIYLYHVGISRAFYYELISRSNFLPKGLLGYALLSATVVLVAYVSWRFAEVPARRWIVRRFSPSASPKAVAA